MYDVAPVAVFHRKDVLVGTFAAPLEGETSVGGGGGETPAVVVKLETDE